MLLIFPPVAKPCEPPAGVARLAGALAAHGVPCRVLDANLEGLLHLLGQPQTASDTWSRRAVKNLGRNLAALREPRTYQSHDRYNRAVKDVNRVLETASINGAVPGLADYRDENLSPLRSGDLLSAAEHPERNPFYPWFHRRLPDLMAQGHSSFVGFSLNYLNQALCAFAMAGYIKKEFPRVNIVLGGGLVSSWMKRPGWSNPFGGLVDHCIAGPGEGPLLDLLGIKDRKPAHSLPDYGSLCRGDYLSPGFILPYSGSHGCSWGRCSFCPENAEDNPYEPVPVARAVAEIALLARKFQPALLHLLDNSVSPALMRGLVVHAPGVPWYGFARIGRELLDLDFCRELALSGCAMLKLGLESGDQSVLDKLRKGIDLETASRALVNLKKAGISTYLYLLFGTPSETVTEARKTLDFVARHQDAISFLNLAIFNMPVCSGEAEEYERSPFYEGDLSLYTGFRHPQGWDRKEVRQFLDNEFKKHAAVSRILKNDPCLFTSNHAAFFRRTNRVGGS